MNITQDFNSTTFNLINELLSSPISFHKIFAKVSGGATEGLFLSQLYQWTQAIKEGEKWVERTYQQWHELTYLTRREIEAARKKLKALGILEEKKVGAKQNILYKLDIPGLFKLIIESCNIEDKTTVEEVIPPAELSGFDSLLNNEVKQLEVLPPKDLKVSEILSAPLEVSVVNHAPEKVSVASEKSVVENIPLPFGKANDLGKDSNMGLHHDLVVSTLPVSVPPEYQPLPLHQSYSSTQKFEDKWKPKPLAPWRFGSKRHDFKPEVVKYLREIYLPKTPFYEGKEILTGQVMNWLVQREYNEQGLAQIEVMMIDFGDYITSPAANAARVMEEISDLPSWIKTSWSWVKSQYKEYLDCGCDLSKFHYTKSQTEIDVWENWISRTFPNNAPNMFADKNKVLNSLRNVA